MRPGSRPSRRPPSRQRRVVHDSSTPSPEQTLAAFIQKRPSIELSTLDLCFVVTLQLQAQEHALPSFREEQLVDAFERVCSIVAPGTELVAARANHTIRRLSGQPALTRGHGRGLFTVGG